MSRARDWCITVNNYTQPQYARLKEIAQEATCVYMVIGKESGSDNGTPHLQVFVQFANARAFGALKKKIGGNPHLEARQGPPLRAANYCKKGEQSHEEWNQFHEEGPNFGKNADFEEFGTLSLADSQGKRSDLEEIKALIDQGASEREIWTRYFAQSVQYHRSFARYRQLIQQQRMLPFYGPYKIVLRWEEVDPSKSVVVVGPSGSQKSNWAISQLKNPLFVSHLDKLADFQEEIHGGIIFDDMCFVHMPREAQIHLLDQEQPRQIHIRYGIVDIPPGTKKIFTCNPEGFPFKRGDSAIDRRIELIYYD